ncbi:hypothetical protein HV819_08010 [Anaerococcus sp. AGMB00486]|uniref:Uncharacterized protein n=1 Tax=Anaerococcus faecalis TaxID=2742993 RepID=A0ABX2NBS4_9FIRM|nr:hypothetical protein [Anaerococcus faecalis]NVF11922.1 hypothetical protein [Anaerococcus faecalis]
MMGRIKDFLECSKYAFTETVKKLKRSYILFIFIVIRSMFEGMKGIVFFDQSFESSLFSSLINYFIEITILCFIAQSLRSIVLYNNTGKKSIENSISNFFYLVMSAVFCIYIMEFVINNLTQVLSPGLRILILFLFKIITSAFLELVYIENVYGFSIIGESFRFVKNNILTWGVYAVIFTFIEGFLIKQIGLNVLNMSNEAIFIMLLALWDTLFLLFKGNLFKFLNKHSYRQRKFMRG